MLCIIVWHILGGKWCRFFVIANGNAALHNLVMIAMEILGTRYDYKGPRLALIAILDMVLDVIISTVAYYYKLIHQNIALYCHYNFIIEKNNLLILRIILYNLFYLITFYRYFSLIQLLDWFHTKKSPLRLRVLLIKYIKEINSYNLKLLGIDKRYT